MFGKYEKRIPIHLFTGSEGTLESYTSTKPVERKSLRMVIQDLKERLINQDIVFCQWILMNSVWEDALTMEMEMVNREGLQELNQRVEVDTMVEEEAEEDLSH